MTTRVYVRTTDEAHRAVADITRMVKGGQADPLVAFDFETMPIAGLEQYPGTTFDDAGERVKPKKKDYLVFAQERWFDSFNPHRLAELLDLRVPWKTTSSNERPGVPAKVAWQEFWTQLRSADNAALDECRWVAREELMGYQAALEQEIDDKEVQIAELSGAKGKKKAVEGLRVEVERLSWRLSRIPSAFERVGAPLDVALLKHIVAVGVENRVKVDPVRPGLDPATSDVFTVQITLRETLSRGLRTWVFNTAKVPLAELEPLFRLGRAYTYLAHNAKFDLKLLMEKLGLMAAPRNVFCTRVGSRMLHLGLKKMSHSLKACAARFANVQMQKGVRDTFIGQRRSEPTEEQIEYGAVDTEVLFAIYDRQMQVAQDRGQVELLNEFSKLSWITAVWEQRGYLVDAEKWLAIAADAAFARDDLAGQIERLLLPEGYEALFAAPADLADSLDDDTLDLLTDPALDLDEDALVPDMRPNALIRVSQTALVCDRLREVLGEKVAARAFPDGKLSLKKDARGAWERAYRDLNGGETHPFFRLYELWSKRAKQASTYGQRFLWAVHPLTGRIHPSLNIAGTDTGRYSSTVPNVLNIPAAKEEGDPDFRGAFLAPDGCYLLGGDMEAMELRIAGNVTEEPVVKKMIEAGGDPHSFTAAQMFHIRKAKVSAPRKLTDKFKYGTTTLEIDVYEVPDSWSAEKIADFALTDDLKNAVKQVTNKATRTIAKTVTFLWLFRGTAFTLAMRTGLPVEQCEDFFDRFNRVYAAMAAGMDALATGVLRNTVEGQDGRQYAYATAYGGLRRWFELPENPSRHEFPAGWSGDGAFYRAQKEYGRRLRSIQREACNVPMQGGNAMVTARALNLAVERGLAMGVLPWLAIYDEIIAAAPQTVRPVVVKGILESSVLDAAEDYMMYIPCGYEADLAKVSHCWVKS